MTVNTSTPQKDRVACISPPTRPQTAQRQRRRRPAMVHCEADCAGAQPAFFFVFCAFALSAFLSALAICCMRRRKVTRRRLRESYKHLAAAVQHATTSDAQAQQERQGQEAAAAAVVEFIGR